MWSRDILDTSHAVVVRIVSEDGSDDAMLGFTEPAVLEVLQDSLYLGARTGDVASIRDGDRKSTAQETAEMGVWVGETVLFVVAAGEGDEDAEVMLARGDAD